MADSSIEIQISARGADEVVKNFKAINAQVKSLNDQLKSSDGINKFVKSMKDASQNFAKALKSMQQALDKIKGSTQALQNAQNAQAKARSRQIRNQIADLRALGTAERQATRLQARFDRAGFDSGGGPLRAATRFQLDVANLGMKSGPDRTLAMVRAQQRFNRAIDASQEKFRNLNGTVDTAVRKTQKLGMSFGSLRGVLLNTGVALSSITAILGFREVLDAVRTIQRFQFTIQAASNDSATFAKNLKFLDRAAQEIGINIAEVGQPFGRFILAAKQSGIEGDVANQAFAKIAASMRNLGGSAADTAGVVRAFEQSLSKGKFMAEEVRLQLGDRLPVAMAALQTATGMTGEELNKAFEAGELSTEKFFLPFVQALFDATGGSDQLASASRGLAAEQARLSTAGLKAAEAFGEGGFTKAVTDLNKAFAEFLSDEKTLQGLRDLGALVSSLARTFGFLAASIGKMMLALAEGLKFAKDVQSGSNFGGDTLPFGGAIGPQQIAALALAKNINQETLQATIDRLIGGTGLLSDVTPNPAIYGNPPRGSVLGDRFAPVPAEVSYAPQTSLRPRPRPTLFQMKKDEARELLNDPIKTTFDRNVLRFGAANLAGDDLNLLREKLAEYERIEKIQDTLAAAITNGTVTNYEQIKSLQTMIEFNIDYGTALEDAIKKADEDNKEKAKQSNTRKQLTDSITQQTAALEVENSVFFEKKSLQAEIIGLAEIDNQLAKVASDLMAAGTEKTIADNLVKELRIQLEEQLADKVYLLIEAEKAAAKASAEREAAEAARIKAAEDAEKRRLAAEAKRIQDAKDAAREKVNDVKLQIQTMDAENDAMRRGAAALKNFNEALAEENALRQLEKQLTDENISAKEREFLLDEMRRVQKERKVAQRGPQTLTDGFIAAGETLNDYFQGADSPGQALEKSLVGAFNTGYDALQTFITTGKMNFADLRDQIIIDIGFAMAKAFALKALDAALFGTGSLIGFANGGIMTSSGPLPLNSYARGGVARNPQMALFGEGSQPEAYVPLPDGRTIPVTMKGGGAGMTIVQNFDFSNADSNTEARLRQAAAAIAQTTKQAIYSEMQDGGTISKISGRR